ncbi:MAG: hypothetical protein V3V30_03035 [Parvularculaceae bacterium]
MKNNVVLSLSLICGFLVILGLSYFTGNIIGTTEAHLENQDRGIFLDLLRPLGLLLFFVVAGYGLYRLNKSGIDQQRGIFIRYGALLFGGILCSIVYATWQIRGVSLWLIPLAALVAGCCWLVFRPSKEGEATDLQDLLMGDMSDPKQRNIMIRTLIALVPHMWLASLVLENTMTPVSLGDGLVQAELLTIAAIIGFLVTLFWLLYECKLFFELDEYIKQIYAGPLLLGLIVAIILLLLNDLAVRYFALEGVTLYWKYMSTWLVTGLLMMVAAIRGVAEEAP